MNETRDGETMNIVKFIMECEAPVTLDAVMLNLLRQTLDDIAWQLAQAGPANPYEEEQHGR